MASAQNNLCPWDTFEVIIRQTRTRRHYKVADQTISMDVSQVINPVLMQFIIYKEAVEFSQYMETNNWVWVPVPNGIEVTDTSSIDIEATGIKVCNSIVKLLFKYDHKPIMMLDTAHGQIHPNQDEVIKISDRYKVSLYWKDDTNYLWIVGKRNNVEKCHAAISEFLEQNGLMLANLTEESLQKYWRDKDPDSKTKTTAQVVKTDGSILQTKEGIVIRIYTGSILHLDVDCIVNAANEKLQHGGGVARVIADAAGYEFDKESRDYISNHGPLGVGQVCTTSAGNLKYKGVIHAVGPRWYEYGEEQKQYCLFDLKTAVISSLAEAGRQRFRSIAIPAIGSGIFGVPKDLCAQQYNRAMTEYSVNRGPDCSLTEVHFIDKDTQMCQLIKTTFTTCFGEDTNSVPKLSRNKGTPGGFLSKSIREPSKHQAAEDFQRNRSQSYNESSTSESHKGGPVVQYTGPLNHHNSNIPSFVYKIGDKLTVALVQDNIVKAKTEAIVSPENILCDSRGRIAKEIAEVAGKRYVENYQSSLRHRTTKLKLTEVLETKAAETEWQYVLHVVAPRWDRTTVKDNQQYEKDLTKSYENILYEMDKLKLTSIALPILGTGSPGFTTPYNTIARVILCVSKEYTQRITSEKRLYFYCNDSGALGAIKDVFDQECQYPADKISKDCCICMDKVTDPKRLTCGHTFCTDCIETQFKYKPACPSCGAVHGKIIGDQPPGTISIHTSKSAVLSLSRTTSPQENRGNDKNSPGGEVFVLTFHDLVVIEQTECVTVCELEWLKVQLQPNHPTPGKHYQGITRTGYLPDNDKGRLVAKLLKIAFDRKLVFTIGRSRITGHDGVVTWNDIHHKTRQDGGPQAFGYPDPTYLVRVLEELKVKGITEESLNDP